MGKVKVAILGHGHLGKWHTQKAQGLESCELVAIVEPFNQDDIKKSYPGVKVVSQLEDIIDAIDAAIVVTPTSTHFELVKQLLQANKHVFCEKPLCSTTAQVEELRSLRGEKKFQVGHSERCHQAWEIILPQIPNSKKTLKINRFAPFKGRATDVDVVQDLMIHDIDLMLYTLKQKPVAVNSIGHVIRTDKPELYDHVTSHFYFENGDECLITSGRNHVQEVRTFELMSAEGCLEVDLFRNKISYASNKTFEDGRFVKEESYEKRDHLLIEQERFYQSILNNEPEFVTFEDGATAVFYVEQVLKSLKTGKRIEL